MAQAVLRRVRLSGLLLRVWGFIAPPGIGIETQVNPSAQMHIAQDFAHRFALVNAAAQWTLSFSLVFIGASILFPRPEYLLQTPSIILSDAQESAALPEVRCLGANLQLD